jgi:exosome complex component RRP40
VLTALGDTLQFELAVGLNGRVWACAPPDPSDPAASKRVAILVTNAISSSEFLSDTQAATLVHRLLRK